MLRRTPLNRSQKPLKRSPLRRVSKGRAKEQATYKTLRIAFLTEHPDCQACETLFPDDGKKPATDVHHRAQRHGKLLNDVSQWLATCRTCHDFIHQNGQKAREHGFLAPRGTA